MTESLGFLLSDTARLLRRRFDERARSSGASVAQWRMLKTLHRHPGLNQGQLAEQLEVEPITACRMIDRLEEAGFVERRRDPADRRAWRIHLTDKADPVLDDLQELAGVMIEDALQGLSSAQREQLVGSLEAIRANLNNVQEGKEAANG
ncbi:MarR family winged helix-turn-helix transcriptional regulator [Sphingomonas kyeonggiensis]|uniref:DNA-binding MarR family transcriptional regulator n=1 Tax=Sphingomonas kyeonggiensis TaxID=1268553 RepID=A0A7W6NW42_9SPHN|nr:MarR family transcriptional regulator [Sphingomonas kyeonggiensis]MBB4097281.1 DNA-binding MarR family transcriptional regulator [Sphingomonas kyeonggiensis]